MKDDGGEAAAGSSLQDQSSVQRLASLVWLAALVGHATASALWWWLQPGGFPVWHPRFWINGVVPTVVLAWSVGSLRVLHRRRSAEFLSWLSPWPALWAGLAVAGRVAFPVTLKASWLAPVAGSSLLALCLVALLARTRSSISLAGTVAAGVGFFIGVIGILAQRPPAPTASPLPADGPTAKEERPAGNGRGLALPTGAMVDARGASIQFRHPPLTIFVSPLLRFLSRSPDGCWTVFVPRDLREEREPRLLPNGTGGEQPGSHWSYLLPGQGRAWLRVDPRETTQGVDIEAVTNLERPVHSHLNSFCDLEVRGHRRLFLTFSPRPEPGSTEPDYPGGAARPVRLRDRGRRFRVAEAVKRRRRPVFPVLAKDGWSARVGIVLHDQDRLRPGDAGRLGRRGAG
ncbi:MAG: hypothetical protein U0790_29175 [Isosphaeraceae bacterium]